MGMQKCRLHENLFTDESNVSEAIGRHMTGHLRRLKKIDRNRTILKIGRCMEIG